MSRANPPEWAYFMAPSCDQIPGKGWRVSILVAGRTGHFPTGLVSNGRNEKEPFYLPGTFEEAERSVREMNHRMGVDDDAFRALFAAAFPTSWDDGEPVHPRRTRLLCVTSPEFRRWRPHVEIPEDLTTEEVREVAGMMAADDDGEWEGLADAPLRIREVRATNVNRFLRVRRTATGGLRFVDQGVE